MTEWQNELHAKMLIPETRQTDSNTVILTEPLWNNMLMMLLYVHHKPKWCFSDEKLRNLTPWFCRDFCHFFQFFTAIFGILTTIFF